MSGPSLIVVEKAKMGYLIREEQQSDWGMYAYEMEVLVVASAMGSYFAAGPAIARFPRGSTFGQAAARRSCAPLLDFAGCTSIYST